MHENDEFSFDDDSRAVRALASSPIEQYLAMSVSGLELGVPLSRVSEVVPYEGVSDLPGAPDYVRGLVHVRDRLVPVVDLALKLGRDPVPVRARTCILMLDLTQDNQPFPLGIVMDRIATLLEVDRAEIKEAPRMGSNIQIKYLQGIVRTARGMLPLIDVEALFNTNELQEVAEISSHAPSSWPEMGVIE